MEDDILNESKERKYFQVEACYIVVCTISKETKSCTDVHNWETRN